MTAVQAQAKFPVKGTILFNGLRLSNSMHVGDLNETLISVGQICNTNIGGSNMR